MLNNFSWKLPLICAAGVILNVAGSIIAHAFNLPVYLDTTGTIFIAALGGYVPGITVGFFTNLIGSAFNNQEMYFSVVSILIAIVTAFLANKGYYKKFTKVLMTIPLTALLTSCFGVFIEELLAFSHPFESASEILNHFLGNFMNELPDKGLAILAAFLLLKIIPPEIKSDFRTLGKMQAPLSPEMQAAMKSEKNFIASLRTKMIFNLMSITLLVTISITAISYALYEEAAIEDRKRIADGIISMAVNEINPNRVDEFLALGYGAADYSEVEKKLYKIRASNSDIKFLYVYKIKEDGCHVVFDLDTTAVEASEPGEIEDFDPTFYKYKEDLLAGRPIPPVISNDKYGYLLTIYKPVYNSVGQCTCYAALDFSMDLISDYTRTFISKVIALFSGALIFIFALGMAFIENNIILPVNTMAYCARNFAYDSEEARGKNIERIKSLEIKTNDEIENLYAAFLKTTSDSMNYFENFKRAEVQVAVMNELAHTDSLTGIKNKTAYTEKISLLDADIAASRAEFCIVMIDVNYLKRVNDTYGHERGNEYLINACKLACAVFGEENVYRIGGDEFVAIFSGEQVAACNKLVKKFNGVIKKIKADKSLQEWEKVSAAVGVAHYRAGVDGSADEVFKRADKEMYANKLAMKAVRRD